MADGETETESTGEDRLEKALFSRPLGQHKSITLLDISKASGVSQGAVSSMLNGRNYGIRARKETRDRVFRVCRQLGYVPNDLRAVVRMYPEMGDLCILRARDGDDLPFFRSLVSHVIAAVHEAMADCTGSISLSWYHADIDYRQDPEKLPRAVRSGVATQFLVVGQPNESLFATLLAENSAVVTLSTDYPNEEVATVRPNYAEVPALALRYLHSLGHRDIAVLTNREEIRHPGFAEMRVGVEIARKRLNRDGSHATIVPCDLSFDSGARFVDSLAGMERRPTAVFSFGDGAAAGILSRAHAVGLHVPNDLSVVGCSHDLFPEMLTPRLTSIRLPVEEMAKEAVNTAQAMVSQPSCRRPIRSVLRASLLKRESCAKPPK